MTEISASILSANKAILGPEVAQMVAAGVDSIHFDVMDMNYVPNLTFGPCILSDLKPFCNKIPINVHLMVNSTNALIPLFAQSGATCIIFHPKTVEDVSATINIIKSNKCQTGIALNPDEDVSSIEPWLDIVDRVLLMSVYPGFAGQDFIPHCINKIDQIKHKKCIIEVDGGIKLNNCRSVAQAGADSLVIGSGLYNLDDDYKKSLLKFRQQVA